MLHHGVLAVVREQHARYHSQVFKGERVQISTTLYPDGARLYFLHEMQRDGIVVIDDLVEAALMNEIGKPARIPPALIQEMQERLIRSSR